MKTPAQEEGAVLRRAIMQVKPEYFSWPIEKQEKYRVAMPSEDWFRIRQQVMQSLFQIEVATEADLDSELENFNDGQRTLLSAALLPLVGIGEDFFWLNESLGEKTLLDFTTLHDYDLWDHRFQENARKETSPDYVLRPYRGSLYLTWARLYMDGRFYYATLSMAAGYLLSRIDDAGYEQIERLIPHRYVDGERHGESTQGGVIFDRRIDAGGLEVQCEELNKRFHRYLSDRHEILQQEFDSKAGAAVWLLDQSTVDESNVHIVFSDKTALERVNLRHFVADCRALSADRPVLHEFVERERLAVTEFLDGNYQEIMRASDTGAVQPGK